MVRGDATRLRQVVNNLIDNALKFTEPGGRVEVNVHRDEAHDHALLSVADSGVGISPHDLPHIFERFYQSDKSRTRQAQARGNGLGLSICQAIVESHGGRIEVESQQDKGTTFRIWLPGLVREELMETQRHKEQREEDWEDPAVVPGLEGSRDRA
jgi:signal transduction histidine kinase